jgi:hypothetical protein
MHPERRYAEWLPGARMPRKSRIGQTLQTLCSFVALATLGYGILYRIDFLDLFGILLGACVASYVIHYVFEFLDLRRQLARVPSRDLPSATEQFAAVLHLHREVEYGTDEGLVSFIDGWLLFSGRYSNFSLRVGDVRPHFDEGQTAFHFDGPFGEHRAILHPMDEGFMRAWRAWASTKAMPAGTTILPPVAVLRGYRKDANMVYVGLFVFAFGISTFRIVPLFGIVPIGMALIILADYGWGQASLRRIARGLPPLDARPALSKSDAP